MSATEIAGLSIEESKRLKPGDPHYRAYVGPPVEFDFMGATQFRLLTSLGLREEHQLLDIGCGSLRGGRFLIQYLLPGRYHGIEPNSWLIESAIEREVGRDLIRLKEPSFSPVENFDYGVFGKKFDFVVAQSILSHTGHDLMRLALAGLPAVMEKHSLALANIWETKQGAAENDKPGWIYRSSVRYHASTILRLAEEVGLLAQRLPWFHPRLTWYLFSVDRATLLTPEELAQLGSGRPLRDDRFP